MNDKPEATYRGGGNIAMKVPARQWEQTVAFYRGILKLQITEQPLAGDSSVCFEFGASRLWIDRVDGLERAEIWLELVADDVQQAAAHFQAAGVKRRDEVEPLPQGFDGFWIENPAAVIHLISAPGQ